jgi:RNA polymerase sigma-70 factor, ECF subfamily
MDAMDQRAFQAFYQERFKPIYRFVYKKVGNREEAEDLTSEIFLKAMNGINLERDPMSIQQWLYLVTRTIIADYWRRYYRMPMGSLDELCDDGWEEPAVEEPMLANIEQVERVQHILQELPERYREVLTCRFLLNLSVNATALRMDVTVANVKILQYRALKRAADLEHVVNDLQLQAG